MSSMKKVKREIKELKHYFFGISQISIKEEVCPLVLSYITSTLTELGKVKNLFFNFYLGRD